MSGSKLLLDTNIVLYLLGGELDTDKLPDADFVISVITELELLSYPNITDDEIEEIKKFLSEIEIIELNANIKSKAIQIRKEYNLKLPDAIITATSQYNDFPLATCDKLLKKVKEIKIADEFCSQLLVDRKTRD